EREAPYMGWFYVLPIWLTMLLCVAGSAGLACAALALTRSRVTRDECADHNEFTGVMLQVIGTILALIMAFMVVTVWEKFVGAENTVATEAGALSDVAH